MAQSPRTAISVETFVDSDAIDQLSTPNKQSPNSQTGQTQCKTNLSEKCLSENDLSENGLSEKQTYQRWISAWLNALEPQFSPIDAYEIGLKLTNDHEIQQLNTDYRQKEKPTDVLSFAALETDLPGLEMLHKEQPLYLGDIIISVETAARQASSARHSLRKEIAWLTAHGLLHLLGWDHPDDDSLEIMLNKQTELLALVKM